MRSLSIPGKWIQFTNLPWPLFGAYVCGWLKRKDTGTVPCLFPSTETLVRVPLRDFYDSFSFFCESDQGTHELAFFLGKLRPGDVFYDVGAFRGACGAAAKAALGNSVTVHLFEPLEENLEAIRAIGSLNGFEGFKPVGKALGRGNSIVGVLNSQEKMVRLGDVSASQVTVELPSTSLDIYVAATGATPSVIKIDVEGFELEVLEGARQCLAEHKPRLWLELHPTFLAAQGRHWKEAIAFLVSLGYRTTLLDDYELPQRENSFHVWAEPNQR